MVTAPALRVVFFGTPAFAVPTLNALIESRHRVVGIVTQPDRPRGRGQKLTDAPVKTRAIEAGLPVLQPDRLKDLSFLSALAGLNADIGVVAAYGKILTDAVLAAPRMGLINVHASLLPRHRGAAPVHRAVIAGDVETGVTIMRVVKALDAGPMMAALRQPIAADETSEEVERKLAHAGAALLVSTLDDLTAGAVVERPQDDSAATYAPRLTKEDGAIDWDRPAVVIHNLVRGLHPWPHAFSFLNGERLIVLRTSPEAIETHPPPGTVIAAHGDELLVSAGEGGVRIERLQAEGKRPMTPREFLSGHAIAAGDRFVSRP
jgi:methionyl-tRNA formyltransferase